MSNTNLTRPSRDGDQFHYLWAARQCLRLLSTDTGLVAITIEGPSLSENETVNPTAAGEELIDVGEYYGCETIEKATRIRYIQLKHSTLKPNEPWTASGLKKTISGFADRYQNFEQTWGAEKLDGKLEFCFLTNRPISSDFLETVEDVVNEDVPRHPKELEKLKNATNLCGLPLTNFCKLLRIEGNLEGCWEQRLNLSRDISGYLPDNDVDAPIQLKELVTRKALSENAENPTITKTDVLRALKTDESRLFPAQCLIKEPIGVVPREQESFIIDKIITAGSIPVIIHADGGVGKSVFSTRIKLGLPTGSTCILYDCFGDSQYRRVSAYRHRHKDALVQIANELAAKGHCHPLIPTANADSSDYLRSFIHRLKQSIVSLRAKGPTVLLCIIIDAADNAQMAAEEIGESRSFVRDLLREKMPDGVRLVMLCRTHRQEKLNPPPQALRFELQPFNQTETAANIRHFFPDATKNDINEFHRLSSQNPRVQAMALSRKITLPEILRGLGPNPTTAEDMLVKLFDNAVVELCDKAEPAEREQINLICTGIATLRPLVPIRVLSIISKVDESAIRSFVFDIGRPLAIIDNSIHFYDEFAETWFQERFKPSVPQRFAFIENLKPLASQSAYIASTLPQLMLEAGQLTDLIELALSTDGLPEDSPIEKRDIELQRLQFALKASLKAKRYTDATKLALKAGGEIAGDNRQQQLFQDNTDLASVFLDVDRIQEIVYRRIFGNDWVGSHHVYEAGIMSGRSELLADARSRLRMAHEWLRNWSGLSDEQRERECISDDDIAEMAMAHLNVHDKKNCIGIFSGWRPRKLTFKAARILARRLIDHGRYDELNQIMLAAENDIYIILAMTIELREVHRNPPKQIVEHAFRLLFHNSIALSDSNHMVDNETIIKAVTALVVAGVKLLVYNKNKFAALLTRCLPDSPPYGLSSRFGECNTRFVLLRAYTLRAAINGCQLNLIDLAYPELQKKLEKDIHHNSREAQEFRENVGSLLPWHQLWANTLLGLIPNEKFDSIITDTLSVSTKAATINYREEFYTSDEIVPLWLDILIQADGSHAKHIDAFDKWINNLKRPLSTSTLTQIVRVAARQNTINNIKTLAYANKSYSRTSAVRIDAEEKASNYVDLARAVLTISKLEAAAYFNEAVKVTNEIGDENSHRWDAWT